MRRDCIICGTTTIVAREIDGNIRVLDEQPVEGGPLVAWGDMQDKPTIFWNVDPAGEALPFGRDGITVTADACRYRLHDCETARGEGYPTGGSCDECGAPDCTAHDDGCSHWFSPNLDNLRRITDRP